MMWVEPWAKVKVATVVLTEEVEVEAWAKVTTVMLAEVWVEVEARAKVKVKSDLKALMMIS
jgi:hypothetical protein